LIYNLFSNAIRDTDAAILSVRMLVRCMLVLWQNGSSK